MSGYCGLSSAPLTCPVYCNRANTHQYAADKSMAEFS